MATEDKRETRNYSCRVSAQEESRTVEGYALLFDTPSDGLSFEEVIEPGALDGVLERSDVFALMNHDRYRGVLARSKRGKGSLQLEVDAKGLKYSFEAPKTALGDELLENIRRGEVVPGMSRQEVLFAYGPPPACRTPSLRNETWIYWIAPEQTIRVVFRNDKVRNIINTNE